MYEPEVNRGAALLDRIAPDWASKVDLEELNMTLCSSCVLGQVFGDYDEGLLTALEIDVSEAVLRNMNEDDMTKIQDHGFCLFDNTYGYMNILPSSDLLWRPLERAWLDLIKARQEQS